nr:MAG TPA: hypothetical protein [Caudoviricetes sp.]
MKYNQFCVIMININSQFRTVKLIWKHYYIILRC